MLSFSGSLKVFVALEPCDLRKSFEGLHALVTTRLGEDVRSGALFVFTNQRRTRLKILYWDGSGLWVMTKRLEEGTFAWPKSVEPNAVKLRLRPEALAMLNGLGLVSPLLPESRGGGLRVTGETGTGTGPPSGPWKGGRGRTPHAWRPFLWPPSLCVPP